ncbi:MAG: hypothetical protein ACKOXN_10880, partial [Limnohabitans sp.]
SVYWTAQRLRNSLGEDREIVVNAAINREGLHWLRYQHFVIDASGQARELNGPFSARVQSNKQIWVGLASSFQQI